MTVQLTLPKDVERRLVAEVRSGRHATVQEAILDRIHRSDDPDLLAILREAKTKSFAQIMAPVRKAGDVAEAEIVRLVEKVRRANRSGSARRKNGRKR
jgi:hypothetical protein